MAEYDRVNSDGLLDPELKSKVEKYGREFADKTVIGMGIPTHEQAPISAPGQGYIPSAETEKTVAGIMKPKPGMPTAPGQFKNVSPVGGGALPARNQSIEGISGRPTESMGEATTVAPVAPAGIPEKTAEAPLETGWTSRTGEGIDYKLGPENKTGDSRVNLNAGYNDMRRTAEGEMRSAQEDRRRARDIEEGTSQDFDFSTYKKAMETIGGKPSEKMQTDILSHMFTAHGKRQELAQKMKELGMVHGEGSPQMIAAKSEAQYRDIQGKLSIAKTPAEVEGHLATAAKLRAEIEKIPHEIALVKEHTNYYRSLSDTPEVKMFKTQWDGLIKLYENALPGSLEQKEFKSRLDQLEGKRMAAKSITEFNARYGTDLPLNPVIGTKHDTPMGKVTWNGEKWIKA